MNLSKTIQQNDRWGFLESGLTITVDYNPNTNTVDAIIHVTVYNYKHSVNTDITAIMWDMYEPAVDQMIESIDWRETYADYIIDHVIHTS